MRAADKAATLCALPCSSPSDLMHIERDADGGRRYFRAHSEAHEEYGYRRPFILELEITRRCNLSCIHCYAEAENRVFDDELSLSEIHGVLDAAKELTIPELSLTGGEVFLRPDFLDIVDAGIARGFNVRFVTNATLLTDALLESLCRRPIKLITVSLDAMSKEVHEAIRGPASHALAMENILRLKAAGFRVSVITAFSKINLPDFDALFAFCNAHRINWQVQITAAKGRCQPGITLNPSEYYTLGEKVAEVFTAKKQIAIIPMDDLATFSHFAPLCRLSSTWQGMCTGGLLNLFVRANGDVTPCSALAFPSCIVGNIRKDRLMDICREERCRTVMSRFSKETRQGACRVCPFLESCSGGCPEILLSMCKDPAENDYCYHKIEQERILSAVR